MKTHPTLAVVSGCVLLLLAGCDRAKLDRLGEGSRSSLDGVVFASIGPVHAPARTRSGPMPDSRQAERAEPARGEFEGIREN